MENWFIASLNVLIVGLSLKVIARTLSLTTESPKGVITQLAELGFKILYAGIAIFSIGLITGIITWILKPGSQAEFGITSIGLAVILLGGGTILRARGHRHEKIVQIGACVLIGIGAGVFLGLIVCFISSLLGA